MAIVPRSKKGQAIFYHDKRTQYTVRVEKPNPLYAKMLQQALGGIEGEIRVMMQYLFQSWNSRGPTKYRDMLLETGTEEMGHVEMYATAIALNLEGSPAVTQEAAARQNPMARTRAPGKRAAPPDTVRASRTGRGRHSHSRGPLPEGHTATPSRLPTPAYQEASR